MKPASAAVPTVPPTLGTIQGMRSTETEDGSKYGPPPQYPIESVDNALRLRPGKNGGHRRGVRQVGADEGEARLVGQPGQPRFLEADVVVVVYAVKADDVVPAGEQPLRHMESDKAGCPGHEYSAHVALSPGMCCLAISLIP